MKNLSGRLRPTDDEGNPTGEEVFNFKPRAFLVVGLLSEFVTEFGANEQMIRSFELYRNSIEGIEILTFDEVFERSRFIAEVRTP